MKILGNIILAAASTALCLLVGETVLRLIDRTEHTASYESLPTKDGIYRLLETAGNLSTNADKILVVGDSFVLGEKCGNQLNPVAQLGRYLEPSGVSAVNLGVEGTGPIDYLIRLDDVSEALGPPLAAIIVLYYNDVEISTSLCRNRQYIEPSLAADTNVKLEGICGLGLGVGNQGAVAATRVRRIHTWLRDFYTWRLVREVAVRLLSALGWGLEWGRTSYFAKWTDNTGVHQQLILAALKEIRMLGKERSIPIYFVIYPDVASISPDNPQIGMYESFIEAAALSGTEVADAWGYFLKKASGSNLSWSILDEHPNCDGHSIFAEFLYKEILRAGAIVDFGAPASDE